MEIAIYDLRGRAVRDFGALRLEAGRWAMSWDGRDDRGSGVGAGSYFNRVSVDGASAGSGKLSLLR